MSQNVPFVLHHLPCLVLKMVCLALKWLTQLRDNPDLGLQHVKELCRMCFYCE